MNEERVLHSIETDGAWNVAVLEYGITHRVLRVALFREHFIRRIELTGGDSQFEGSLELGPVQMKIIRDGSGQPIGLDASGGAFRWRFSRLAVLDRRGGTP